MMTRPVRQPIVFFDGQCPLCHWFVRMLLRWDKRRRLSFSPLQGKTAQELLGPAAGVIGPHVGDASLVNRLTSVVLLDGAGMHIKSSAALRTLVCLGGLHRLWSVFYAVPRRIRDGIYDWVARNRNRWFGRLDSCPTPDLGRQGRFLP